MYRNAKLLAVVILPVLCVSRLIAQTCTASQEMDESTRSSLERTARQFFDYASKGDVFNLKQSSTASLASNFSGIEDLVVDQRSIFSGAQSTMRASYVLEQSGATSSTRAEFLCGVWATPQYASFGINNLPPGRYGLVIQDVTTSKGQYALSMVLKQEGGAWKLGGYYSKPKEIGGHDAQWFLSKAREYKATGATHSAWFYYLAAWDLSAPVDFMDNRALEKISNEMQTVRPADLPTSDHPMSLTAGGRSYQLIYMSALPVKDDLDLLVKYRVPDVSNTQQMFDDNVAVIKAVLARYPEFRQAFAGVLARATEPSGRDYGTLLAMKDVK